MQKHILMLGAAVSVLALANVAKAADPAPATPASPPADASSGVQSIVVTARKRSENLERVPVAITAQSGQQLKQEHVQQFTDLAGFVPSLQVETNFSSPTAANFELRGISSPDLLLTFSPPVGIYEDTAPIPYPIGTNLSFVDLSRVEVLKGPQGTLYGRNTTGGAVNIITQGADYNGVHGYLTAQVGNYGDQQYTGAVNVPLIDDVLAVRLVGQYWYREGYMHDLYNGQWDGGSHDDAFFRASIRFDPTSYIHSITKFEYAKTQESAQAYQTVFVGGAGVAAAGLEAGFETPSCAGLLNPSNPASIESVIGCGVGALEKEVPSSKFQTYANPIQGFNVNVWHFVEDATFDLGPDVQLRSITGGHHVASYQLLDSDSTSFDLVQSNAGTDGFFSPPGAVHPWPIGQLPDQEYTTWSQEFDLSGKAFDQRLNWLLGAFAEYDGGNGGQPDAAVPLAVEIGSEAAGPTGPLLPSANEITGSIVPKVDSATWGVYSQDDFKINDMFSITAGARYSEVRDSLTVDQVYYNDIAGTFDCNIAANGADGSTFYATPHNTPSECALSSGEKAAGLSYLLSLNVQLTPSELLYLKTSRGFQGPTLQQRAPDQPPAKPQYATDYEAGLKSQLFDNRLVVNIDGYLTNYKDIVEGEDLVNAAGTLENIFLNAATAQIKGVEFDFTARPTEAWTVYGTASYIDANFNKYTADYPWGVALAKTLGFTTCSTDGFCTFNASGEPFSVPPFQFSIGSRYEIPVSSWGRLSGELDWTWHARIPETTLNSDPELPPALLSEALSSEGTLNGRIQLDIPQYKASVAVFATNLTNNVYRTGIFSLASALGFATATVTPPLMFGVEFHKSFGNGE
jgi:iron complex outermembrane recepter protein